MIRDITADDLPWVLSLGYRRYDPCHYDRLGGLKALLEAMRSDTALALRNDHGFLVGSIQQRLWAPKHPSLHVLAICVEEGHHWAAAELLRASVGWARERGCTKWWIATETEFEVGALAKRIGAHPRTVYAIDLARD